MKATDDEMAGILATCRALETAWAAGDAEAFAALHTEDATYVAFDGTVMVGRSEIAQGHRPLFEGIMRGSRLVTVDRIVQPADAELAIVVQRAGIVMRWQGDRPAPSRKRLSTNTSIFVLESSGWRVRAFQNTRFQPWVSSPAGRIFAPGAPKPPITTLLPS